MYICTYVSVIYSSSIYSPSPFFLCSVPFYSPQVVEHSTTGIRLRMSEYSRFIILDLDNTSRLDAVPALVTLLTHSGVLRLLFINLSLEYSNCQTELEVLHGVSQRGKMHSHGILNWLANGSKMLVVLASPSPGINNLGSGTKPLIAILSPPYLPTHTCKTKSRLSQEYLHICDTCMHSLADTVTYLMALAMCQNVAGSARLRRGLQHLSCQGCGWWYMHVFFTNISRFIFYLWPITMNWWEQFLFWQVNKILTCLCLASVGRD